MADGWPSPRAGTSPPFLAIMCAERMKGKADYGTTNVMHLDAESKADLHAEAEKLIARYESPLETVKALMAHNCELETQSSLSPTDIRVSSPSATMPPVLR
ncbi:hypothetical protein ACFSOZ_00860 [Mesorhizobium newzealandense]|uniref:Uncharacterized protein n=1 Tax=Mesorhizobium newzealandense TaxID=1300302 RepID=A0ABW4U1A4_9HYPH